MFWLGLILVISCGRTALEDLIPPPLQAPVDGTAGLSSAPSGGAPTGSGGRHPIGGNGGFGAGAGRSGGGGGAAGSGDVPPTAKPRYLSLQTFLSSSSTRTALWLFDYSDPDAEPSLIIDSDTYTAGYFSPRGRWFWFHEGSFAQTIRVIDLDRPPPFGTQQLGEEDLAGFLVSPSDEHFAYLIATNGTNELWLRDVAGAVWSEAELVGAARTLLGWADPRTLLLVTEDDTLGIVRVTEQGYALETHPEAVLEGFPWAMSYGERSFAVASGHSILIRHDSGESVDLTLDEAWTLSPGFDLACGGSGTPYKVRALDDLDLSPLVVDLWGTCPEAFAFRHPWFASIEDGALIVRQISELGPGSYDSVDHVVPGDHSTPTHVEFAANDGWLLHRTYSDTWLTALSPDGVPSESQAIVTAGSAQFSADAQYLSVVHEDQGRIGVIELDVTGIGQERLVPITADWATLTFSAESTHAVFYGGHPDFGRAMFLVGLADVEAEPRLVQSCTSKNTSPPACPNSVAFQPTR